MWGNGFKIVYHPKDNFVEEHKCFLPTLLYTDTQGKTLQRTEYPEGCIIQCNECEKFWEVRIRMLKLYWSQTSSRKVKRILKQKKINNSKS